MITLSGPRGARSVAGFPHVVTVAAGGGCRFLSGNSLPPPPIAGGRRKGQDMTRTGLSMAALIAAAPGLAPAQEAILLPEIVISANLEETEASRTGATVSVLTEADLAARGDAPLAEVLDSLPGVTLRPQGPLGTQTGVALRGASQNYVAVIIDGIDVTDPSGTQVAYDFGQLTAAGLSRVEVLRGSQSALYGSRAVGGVISITTRRAVEEGTRQEIAVEGGSYGTGSLIYGLTHKSDRIEAALTLGRLTTDGFSAADEDAGNTEADGFEQSKLAFDLAWLLPQGGRIGVNGFVEDSRGEYDEGFPLGDGTLPGDEIQDKLSRGLRLYSDFATGAVDHSLSASLFQVERRYRDNTIYGASDTTYTGTRRQVAWQGATDLTPAMRLVAGLDWTEEDYDQAGTYGALAATTRTAGAYSELAWALGSDVDVTATLRHDDHSIFGGQTTGRIALAWRATGALTFRAQAGTGYRAPSNFELYSFYGSTALDPETSRNLDLGVEYRWGARAGLRATAFLLEVEDLIDYDFAGTGCAAAALFGPGCYNQVPGTSRRSGVEIEGDLALTDRVTLTANYTYIDSATNASSAWGLVPRHDLGLGLQAQVTDRLDAGLRLTHAADRGGLSDYTVVGAGLGYALTDRAEAYLRIENLFDENYQLVPGYGTAGRSAYVGLRARF